MAANTTKRKTTRHKLKYTLGIVATTSNLNQKLESDQASRAN